MEGDSPTQHVKGGTKFLTDANVEWEASFCDTYDCCMKASESACLRLTIISQLPLLYNGKVSHFPVWQTWQEGDGRDAPGEAGTWAE